jgi:hypothetical protein
MHLNFSSSLLSLLLSTSLAERISVMIVEAGSKLHATSAAREALWVPFLIQRRYSSCSGMLPTARASITTLLGEVFRAIGLVIDVVIVVQRSTTHSAAEMRWVISLSECLSDFARDWLVAFGAHSTGEVRKVLVAIGAPIVLIEALKGKGRE